MASLAKTAAVLFLTSAIWLPGVSAAPVEEANSTLQKIERAGAIAIGYRDGAAPFSYLDAGRTPAGFGLDLCALAAEKIKERLGLADLRIDYKPVTPESRAALVRNGEVDIDCSVAPKSPELLRDAAVSIPVYASQFRWLVPRRMRVEREGEGRSRGEVKTPVSANDLLGKTVVLTQGSKAAAPVLNLSVDRFLGLSIVYAKDPAAAFKLVEAGQAFAFIDDDAVLLTVKANAKEPDAFGFLQESFPSAAYGLVMRKDDAPFKELIDEAISEAMKSGAYAALYSKWFESPIPPNNVNLNYAMPERVKRLVNDPAAVN